MSFTFLNQQEKLSRLLGDPNTGSTDQWPLADRKKELNRGEWKFALDSKLLREYVTSTISAMKIQVPADFVELFSLYVVISSVATKITADRELSVKDLERFWASTSDVPFYYFWEDEGVKYIYFLGSTANNTRTYHLYYIRKPTTELSADSDVSILPEEFREASVYYAASELLRQIGKTQLADSYYARYKEYVALGMALAEKLYRGNSEQ